MSVIRKLPEAFSETRIEDEVVVMALASGDFHSLTGTAARIWELIDGTRDRPALIAALVHDYAAPEAEIAADLDRFLAELERGGLVAAD